MYRASRMQLIVRAPPFGSSLEGSGRGSAFAGAVPPRASHWLLGASAVLVRALRGRSLCLRRTRADLWRDVVGRRARLRDARTLLGVGFRSKHRWRRAACAAQRFMEAAVRPRRRTIIFPKQESVNVRVSFCFWKWIALAGVVIYPCCSVAKRCATLAVQTWCGCSWTNQIKVGLLPL